MGCENNDYSNLRVDTSMGFSGYELNDELDYDEDEDELRLEELEFISENGIEEDGDSDFDAAENLLVFMHKNNLLSNRFEILSECDTISD